MLYPCGQCMPCRFNMRRIWTHRIMLEAQLYTDNTFCTLTYRDEQLPTTSGGLPTLDPVHLKNFLKRVRKILEPHRIRFYAVGEYGDDTQRPHYHLAIFNYPSCLYGRTRHSKVYRPCCRNCDRIYQTWTYGNIDLGTLETSSAQYVAGYVTKKLTSKTDPRLSGRHPEFSRMSLRPGIGHDAMHDVASTWLEFNLEKTEDDVPSSLRHGTRKLPLGRYLTRKLRKLVGKDEKAPDAILKKIEEELRPLRETAFDNSRSFKKEVIKDNDQRVLNMETKQKIFRQRKKL